MDSYICNPDRFLTVLTGGQTYTINNNHPNFTAAIKAVKKGDFVAIPDLVDLPSAINRWAGGKVTVVGGQVLYAGVPVSNGLTDHILRMVEEKFNVAPLVAFMDKLMQHASFRAREQLFNFVDHNQITITKDGNIVLYKRVSANFTDIHTQSIDNSVGRTVEMPREGVDDDPNRTCSSGLHVCSLPYLAHFSGPNTVLCEVDPRDVVSIPTDYNHTKLRVCRYKVVGTHTGGHEQAFTNSPVHDFYPDVDDFEVDDESEAISWEDDDPRSYDDDGYDTNGDPRADYGPRDGIVNAAGYPRF